MVALIRDVTGITYAANDDQPVIPRPQVQAGDILLCYHACDEGPLSDMGIQGQGWTTVAERGDDRPFGNGGGSKIYRKVATGSEPSSYTLVQDRNPGRLADSTVVMLSVKGGDPNNIVARHDGDTSFPPFLVLREAITPAATPPSGSGLELRIATGWDPSGGVSWSTPAGYLPVTSSTQQSRGFVATTMVARTLVTSAPLGSVTLTSNVTLAASHGFTVIVPSGDGGGGDVPTPPSFPAFTPAKGSALYRYTVHDMITGAYRQDIYPTDVTFDRRIGEPGTFSATLPIPNARRADEVARIIPRHASDLTSGPGRIIVHVWRAGVLWGIYWIHGALISKSRRGTVSIQLRGSTLDAYLLHVPVESDLSWTGEQIDNARQLLAHMQALDGANIGLAPRPGTSGQVRPLEVKAEDRTTYGDALKGYAEAYGGFEYVIDPVIGRSGTERRWKWGAPKITSSRRHVFTESPHGGDILDWGEEIDALRGATRARVIGGTPEATDATEGATPVLSGWVTATAHRAAGWPRYGQTVEHPGESLLQSQLDQYAARWIATFGGSLRVYSATVALGAKPTISPSSLGDQVRRVMVNVWHPRVAGGASFDASQRLIGIGITPVSKQTGKEEAQLILEEASVE
ncbi:hypothetical protein [Microtetraspora niveoalba]|uniref:hypothetical protein n=1 Tax=Microtetraspora niveoalba TaxID=46175 RepID=UPI0008307297|nr:hypothetical protein [Microtetraspora niveoalba]